MVAGWCRPGCYSPKKGGHSPGGAGGELHLADTRGRMGTGMVLGRGCRWEIGIGAPITPQISLETNWVSLSRLNPTNVAGFGSRCLHFLRVS